MSDIDIGYDLDPSGYLAGVNAIDQANQRLQASISGVTTTTAGLSKAYSLITPGRATLAGLALLSQQAGSAEEQLSNLQATSAITGANVGRLAGSVRQMSREMPLGSTATRQMVEQFTKMGVGAAGSEARIAKLAQTSSRLAGATGEGPAALAQGLTELSRATGNTQLDPRRFESLSDSLTTISAKSGSSATGILSFSKAIAPMAQAAGIGSTGVLGISSAFARLGEDGFGASTAINKMLSDMNRAVREGSPEMKTYAQMAGKSADEFERLFKSNPAEALTQVTEAIAKAGPAGPRMLEQIGLDGIRSQRSIQALVSSGGLRGSIAEATAAYGSGSTQRASEAAFGGLVDSLNQAREASSQLAEAFGMPLLRPLRQLTDIVTKATGGLAEAAMSGPAQGLMTAGVYGGLGMLGARALAGPLGVMFAGRQMATSGPARALFGGYAAGRGLPASSRMARYGAQMTEAERAGTLRQGFFGGTRGWMYDFGYGFGRQRGPAQVGLGPQNIPGVMPVQLPGAFPSERIPRGLQRFGAGARGWGANLTASYFGMIANQARNARVDPLRREAVWGASQGFRDAWAAARTPQGGAPAGRMAAFTAGMSAFHKEVVASGQGLGAYRMAVGAAGRATLQSSAFIARAIGDVGRGLTGLARMMGPGLLMTAGIGGAMWASSRYDRQNEQRAAFLDQDMSKTINAYRESIGKATDATTTFGSQAAQMNANLATGARERSWSDVQKISSEDVAAALTSKDKTITTYAGSAADIAAQIQSSTPAGMTTEELQAVKVDLLRQMDTKQAGDVLRMLPQSFQAGERTNLAPNELADLVGQVSGSASNAPREGFLARLLGSQFGAGSNQLESLDSMSRLPGWARRFNFGPGGGLYKSGLGEASQAQIDAANEGIGQQYASSTTKFGTPYAEQERVRAINAMLKEAIESGSADAFYAISTKAGMQLGGEAMKDVVWSPNDFERAGGDFSKMIADRNKQYAEQRQMALDAGASFTGKGGLLPELLEQQYTKEIRAKSSFLGDIFDARSKSPGAQAMTASIERPADIGLQSDAMNAVVRSANQAGKSMTDLALEAARAATAVAESSDAYIRLAQIQRRAEFEMSSNAVRSGMTQSQAQMEQYRYYSELANMRPETEAQAAQKQQAKEQVLNLESQMKERLTARLQMQRQYEISVSRAEEDFNRQRQYETEDYNITVFRTERNFGIQRQRAIENFGRQVRRAEEDFGVQRQRTMRDFNKSMRRNEEDYQTARVRQIRDFNINAQRAEQDYQKARLRQFRDFNTALKRQIEDAVASMLDPYERIQTKATYDGRNLLLNMQEQTQFMARQKEQLDAIRKMGLSSSAIDILGLGKTENAQQLNNLMADAQTDPGLIAALNEEAKKRSAAAGSLYTDESNKDLARMREDFNKSLKDQEEDYRKSVERTREDLNRQMADQAADYRKALLRSREDLQTSLADSNRDFAKSLARQREDFNISLMQSSDDLRRSLRDMEEDRWRAMRRAKQGLDTQLARMAEDIKMADQTIAGSMSDLAEQVNRAIHGKSVKWQKILRNDTDAWVRDMRSQVIPKLTAAYADMGLTAADIRTVGAKGVASSGGPMRAYAGGGLVEGHSPHDRADNVPAMLTAKEYVQPVKTVDYYGVELMDKLRLRQIPKEELIHLADGGMVYKQMTKWLHKNIPGARVSSDYRPGAITASGMVSDHGLGRAIDIVPPSMATFEKILRTFNKNIRNLIYSPAGNRNIWMGRPYTPPKVTLANHWDHVHWAMEKMVAGMDVGMLDAILAKIPSRQGVYGALTRLVTTALQNKMAVMGGDIGGGGSPAYKGDHNVARWTDETIKVLGMLNRKTSDAGAVLRRIEFESSGNPRAINLWDSNARRGTPSKGLMQVIDPTFKAYRSKALSSDIYNPTANIYAGSNYAVKRYGSLQAIDPINRPKGYDQGGWMDPGEGRHVNGTGKPEAVLTNEQWDSMTKLAEKAARAVSKEDLMGVNAAGGCHIVVNNHQRYHYDQRNDFTGAQVTVQSEDPDDMGRKLEKKAVEGRLTQVRR